MGIQTNDLIRRSHWYCMHSITYNCGLATSLQEVEFPIIMLTNLIVTVHSVCRWFG